jgi:hypothetical protein
LQTLDFFVLTDFESALCLHFETLNGRVKADVVWIEAVKHVESRKKKIFMMMLCSKYFASVQSYKFAVMLNSFDLTKRLRL